MTTSSADNLVALATDVLAQSEARQRAARRLHQATEDISRSIRHTGGCDALQMQQLRDQTSAMRDLGDAERGLLEEFDAALSALGH
jgi:hypothetical protein